MLRNSIFLILMCIVIVFFTIGVWFTDTSGLAETENRRPASAPTLSLSTLKSGLFLSELGDYMSDRLPLRSALLSLRSEAELALGKREVNGVVVGGDKSLYQKIAYDTDCLKKNIGYYRDFLASDRIKDIPVDFLVLPDSISIAPEENLPHISPREASRSLYFDFLQCEGMVDALEALESARDIGTKIFFSTDHHMTSDGAYIAYKTYMESIGESSMEISFFNTEILSDSFYGSSHTRSGLSQKNIPPDSLTVKRYEGDGEYDIFYEDTGRQTGSFYDTDALREKDKYRAFLGGNFGRVQIALGDPASERPRLLLIKDSFANAIAPYLALHFDIDMIDLRYYGGSLASLLEGEKYDRILFLYGISTLASDGAMRKLSSVS